MATFPDSATAISGRSIHHQRSSMTYTNSRPTNNNYHSPFHEYHPHPRHVHGEHDDDEEGDNADVDGGECEDGESGNLPTWKNIAVAVIVLACLASIYPKALHPLLMWISGYGEQMQKVAAAASDSGAHGKRSDRAGASVHGIHSRIGDFATPGSSPERFLSAASRMAGHAVGPGAPMHYQEVAATESTTTTTGGTWHWLLPCYTIGIVMFLLYTLGKVLWRKPNITARHRYNLRYNPEKDRFEANIPGMESEEEESEDNENSIFGDDEEREQFHLHSILPENGRLRSLQHRLQETESAMQYILTQLEQLSATDPSEVEQFKETATATLNSLKTDNVSENAPSPLAAIISHQRRDTSMSSSSIDATQPARYLDDLEHALEDFKRSSDDYVRKHSRKKKRSNSKQKNEQIATAAAGGKEECERRGDPKTECAVNVDSTVSTDGCSNDSNVIRNRKNYLENSESGATGEQSGQANRVRQRKRKKIARGGY